MCLLFVELALTLLPTLLQGETFVVDPCFAQSEFGFVNLLVLKEIEKTLPLAIKRVQAIAKTPCFTWGESVFLRLLLPGIEQELWTIKQSDNGLPNQRFEDIGVNDTAMGGNVWTALFSPLITIVGLPVGNSASGQGTPTLLTDQESTQQIEILMIVALGKLLIHG